MQSNIISALLFGLASITLACSPSESDSEIKSGGNRIGEFRGYVAINQTIQTRLLEPGVNAISFYLGRYFGESSDRFDGLAVLLGGFSGEAGNNLFRNGDPNSMNMLLWHIALSGFAKDVASSCGTEGTPTALDSTYRYNVQFIGRLKTLCTWPAAEAKSEDSLLQLWLAVIGFDAPRSEFEAWRDFFLDPASPYANATSHVAVEAMLRAALLNPYFLLEH